MIYTIIGGVNGAGKSSLTGVLKEYINDLGVIVDPDKITAQHGGNAMEGGKAAVSKLRECLANRIDFTEESTLAGGFACRMAREARAAGYTVRLYYVGLDSAEESVQRIENRVAHGGHNIPTADVQRRFSRRFADLSKLLPLCNEASFYDNNNGFRLVAVYRNGEIVPTGTYRPKWLCSMMEELPHN